MRIELIIFASMQFQGDIIILIMDSLNNLGFICMFLIFSVTFFIVFIRVDTIMCSNLSD